MAYAALLLVLSPLSSLAQTSLASQETPSLKPVTVNANASDGVSPLDDSPAGIGHVTVLSNFEINQRTTDRLEHLLQQAGLAAADAGSSFGLANGFSIRGFAVNRQEGTNLTATRILLNGHPDIAYRFVRDLSTVESIEVLGGFDATLAGAGAPGGTVQYISKRPRGMEFIELGSNLASDGLVRLTLDGERHFGALQVRAVVASQRGQRTAEGQPTDRDNLLLSTLLTTPIGRFQRDLEHQNNRAPYVFGTLYSQGKFWYDRPYVSPQSRAERRYDRAALDWTGTFKSARTPGCAHGCSAQASSVMKHWLGFGISKMPRCSTVTTASYARRPTNWTPAFPSNTGSAPAHGPTNW